MHLISLIIFGLISCSPLLAQEPQMNDAWSALQKTFSSLSNIDIRYTTTKNETVAYSNELKIRDNLFWLKQGAKNPSDPEKNLSRQIAYNGKLYQALNYHGICTLESTPNLTNIQSLGTTPPVRVFNFMRAPDWHSVNAFEFLRNPENWTKLTNSISDVRREVINGFSVLQMTVKSANGTYQIKLRPDLNYFPVFTRTVNGVGFPVTIECSVFQKYTMNGISFFFPTEITDVLSRSDGSVVSDTKTTINSMTSLSAAKNDNSDFQIDTALAASVFDADTNKYIKFRH